MRNAIRSLTIAVVALALGFAWLTPARATGRQPARTGLAAGAATTPPMATSTNGSPRAIPGLSDWRAGDGAPYEFSRATAFVATGGASGVAKQAAGDLGQVLGFKIVARPGRAGAKDIALRLQPKATDLGSEGYSITVGDGISITARTETGLYWGTRTVMQWATLARTSKSVPAGHATDIPKYRERGVGICACQIQVSPEYVERAIEEMSYYKLNQLWMETKVKSAAYPKANFWGYFTPAEAKRISAFAKRHHVEIIAEVNSPGHMAPWLYKYPELQLTNEAGEAQPDRLDITKPEALKMVTTLFDEYMTSFDTPYWHMGADEYMLGSGYAQYPQIAAYAKKKFGPTATPQDAFVDFINKVDAYVRSRGKRLRIWNDGIPATPNIVKLNSDIVVEHWTGSGRSPSNLLADGHDLMNASQSLYFVRGAYSPNVPQLWSSDWTPLKFSGQAVSASTGPGKVLGAKLSVWPDNGAGDTENTMEAKVHETLRFLAQATWGSERPVTSYADFRALGDDLGNGPAWQNVDYQPLKEGTYTISAPGRASLNAPAKTSDPVTTGTDTAQNWTLKPTPDGYYTVSTGAGRCLDVVGAGTKLWLGVPTSAGIAPQATTCDSKRNLQKWWLRKVAGGYTLTNAIVLLPLHVDGRSVTQQLPDEKSATVWQIQEAGVAFTVDTLPMLVTGTKTTVSGTVTNLSSTTVTDASVTIDGPDGWVVSSSPASVATLEPGASAAVGLTIVPGEGDVGDVPLQVVVSWHQRGSTYTRSSPVTATTSCTADPQSPKSVVWVDSEETVGDDSPGRDAIDGDPATFWGTGWSSGDAPLPHEIAVDLGASRSVCGIHVLPRQGTNSGAVNGQIAKYAVFMTDDPAVAASHDVNAWGAPVATGTLPSGFQVKFAAFPKPVTGRYLMVQALSEQNGKPWTTIAELTVDAA